MLVFGPYLLCASTGSVSLRRPVWSA